MTDNDLQRMERHVEFGGLTQADQFALIAAVRRLTRERDALIDNRILDQGPGYTHARYIINHRSPYREYRNTKEEAIDWIRKDAGLDA